MITRDCCCDKSMWPYLTTVIRGGGLSGVITSDFFFRIAADDDGGRIGGDTGGPIAVDFTCVTSLVGSI